MRVIHVLDHSIPLQSCYALRTLAILRSGKPALINVWIDQNAFAPGTMNQTMYK